MFDTFKKKLTAGLVATGLLTVAYADFTTVTQEEAAVEYRTKELQWRTAAFAPMVSQGSVRDRLRAQKLRDRGDMPADLTPEQVDKLADRVDHHVWKRRLHDHANYLRQQQP